ncbi:MAG: arginase family protein [Promethearchaeota archaeon]
MRKKIKVFGAAVDASDFPLSIQMKLAYLNQLAQNLGDKTNFIDPYEAFLMHSSILTEQRFLKIGKFPIDSWLTPKPKLEDLHLINQFNFSKFTNDGLLKSISDKIERYIKTNVLPDIPLMIGVDHSLTGGVLTALSKEYSPENLLVLIFDAHFDGLPANISINISKYTNDHPNEVNPLVLEYNYSQMEGIEIKNTYTCASFLNNLINAKVIKPENLIIFGCQDYPDEKYRALNDPRIVEFVEFYDKMERNGVKFIPKAETSQMLDRLNQTLKDVVKSNFYLSLDVDVGALKEVIASRFRNVIGLDQSTIISAAKIVNNVIKTADNKLVGLDVMEIETYLLNSVLM